MHNHTSAPHKCRQNPLSLLAGHTLTTSRRCKDGKKRLLGQKRTVAATLCPVFLTKISISSKILPALDHHGIAWKELKITQLREHLARLDDSELLSRITRELDQPGPVPSANEQSRRVKHTPSVNKIVSIQPIDEFACNHCRLSLWKLREMAEVGGAGEVFTTPRRDRPMNIYEVTEDGLIIMRRSTGKITKWALDIYTLRRGHDFVHAGDIELDAREIESVKIDGTRKAATWGTYIAALLKHLECCRI